ncbi:hypothetical protein DACRYDRAFT_113259 [Dacryopinax primogenitus]|uniref:Uncharacterized protein n=1 Tax=Dacryopinax primogenitus (strain DJM 731) TaxID=1858805 RepID=M5GH44_DACPD|nr:uncharacterized protein DACRYDRAFT_113259 [Dacryopinax primogenitus]EJU06593.1 hypothetical protein DACRYDRAFT_113259 [Dacryopinax primogenitus]
MATASGLSAADEDEVIHNRLLNDEKAIRRLTRKFHAYSVKARPASYASTSSNFNELRDAFLVELAQYHLFLRKTSLQCKAEQRQVVAYQEERDRIANLHSRYRDDIATLKQELERAQIGRKQKIEYDEVAAKINALPTRGELEKEISGMEEEIGALQHDKEVQMSLMNARREKFDQLINDINELRWMGREGGPEDPGSPPADEDEPEPEHDRVESGLNPHAVAFVPGSAQATSPASLPVQDVVMGTNGELEEGEEEDVMVEHAEIVETGNGRKKEKSARAKDELEEGEASDGSELTELSD